ncbi:MAG: hypothetical protein ACM3JB_08700 [Acidobacteriaceae bacterium]
MPAEAGASSAVAAQLLEADLVLIEPGSKGVVSKATRGNERRRRRLQTGPSELTVAPTNPPPEF